MRKERFKNEKNDNIVYQTTCYGFDLSVDTFDRIRQSHLDGKRFERVIAVGHESVHKSKPFSNLRPTEFVNKKIKTKL